MADSNFYVDHRGPFMIADPSTVTLAATNKALIPLANLPVLGSNYWWAGKAVRIRMAGVMTPAATPGSATWSLLYGTGADANGTSIAASAAMTLVTGTSLSWWAEFLVRCRSIGTAGSLQASGMFNCNPALVASTAQPVMIPAATMAATGSIDTTAASVISPQMLGSLTTCTVVTKDYIFEALN